MNLYKKTITNVTEDLKLTASQKSSCNCKNCNSDKNNKVTLISQVISFAYKSSIIVHAIDRLVQLFSKF